MISNYFPTGFTPRESQLAVIDEIGAAFEEYDIVICSAPTGTGKSFIAKTLANSSADPPAEFVSAVESYQIFDQNDPYEHTGKPFGANILTITKALQEQYTSLFTDAKSAMGKSSYECAVDTSCSVDIAPCMTTSGLRKSCWKQHICPYYEARNDAIKAKCAVYNYSMFANLPGAVKHRKYLVCDEASEIEEELVSQFTLVLRKKELAWMGIETTYFPESESQKEVRMWLTSVCTQAGDRYKSVMSDMQKNKKDKAKLQKLATALIDTALKIAGVLKFWSECEFVIERDFAEGVTTITPLYVHVLANDMFQHGDKVLLMSATIIDHKNFAKSLGITNYKYIESPTTFDPEKAPIYLSSEFKINYKTRDIVMPKIARLAKEICEHHGDERGVIHTHSMDITRAIECVVGDDPRFRFREKGIDNKMLIEEHASIPNSIIVSPSITHGVDFNDDLARFQIIIKLPYLPLSSKRIKRLFDESKSWYNNKMLSTLMQTCGRGVRSNTDWCVTYILDGNSATAIKRSRATLPQFFLDRIK